MMYLGRYTLGQWLPIPLDAVIGSGAAVTPTAAPTVTIYDAAWTAVESAKKIAPRDRTATGSFEREFYLGSDYAVGLYTARAVFASGGSNFIRLYRFEIVGGGHDDGSFIGMVFFEKPDSPHIVAQQDGGDLVPRRNPRI